MRPSSRNATVSAENVENVVRPPSKPVMRNKRQNGGNAGNVEKNPKAKPTR
jgi:hypothetical protein